MYKRQADEGQALVDEMNATIDEIAAIGATIEDKKTVLFEISALPSIYLSLIHISRASMRALPRPASRR